MTSRIANRSKKRAKQEREYAKIAKEFLSENEYCVVHSDEDTICRSTQIHHKKGRIGSLLTDTRYFLAVCDEAHKQIEANPKWARIMKYSLSRLSK